MSESSKVQRQKKIKKKHVILQLFDQNNSNERGMRKRVKVDYHICMHDCIHLVKPEWKNLM